ncbi:MAG: DUF2283 domain-containing protein [Methanobacteriaceae archaeon]
MKDKSTDLLSLYDSNFDVLGIKVNQKYKYKESIELGQGLILDIGEDNLPVALEILDASKVLNVPKDSLKDINSIKMDFDVNEKLICLKICFGLIIHNKKESCLVESFVDNYPGIPNMETELCKA